MDSSVVLETPRLTIRQFSLADAKDLAVIYSDPETMKFLRGIRTYQETLTNLDWIFKCYQKYGFGLWAVIHKNDNKLIGRCGLIAQIIEEKRETEIAYMLSRDYWHRGLATEAVCAIREYGFRVFDFHRLISLIDPANIASQKVALKAGLNYEREIILEHKPVRTYAIQNFQKKLSC